MSGTYDRILLRSGGTDVFPADCVVYTPPGGAETNLRAYLDGLGAADEQTWTFTGDGGTVTFNIPGRVSLRRRSYRVHVGGVFQAITAFTLPSDAQTIVFTEAPPSGTSIIITT